MTVIRIESTFCVDVYENLAADEHELFTAALAALQHSQPSDSHLRVGVALRCARGCLHAGYNVEHASCTQGMHAEQSAINHMVAAHGPIALLKLAVVTDQRDDPLVLPRALSGENFCQDFKELESLNFPCGHCRQIIWENSFGNSQVEVMTLTANGIVVISDIGSLLPVPSVR